MTSVTPSSNRPNRSLQLNVFPILLSLMRKDIERKALDEKRQGDRFAAVGDYEDKQDFEFQNSVYAVVYGKASLAKHLYDNDLPIHNICGGDPIVTAKQLVYDYLISDDYTLESLIYRPQSVQDEHNAYQELYDATVPKDETVYDGKGENAKMVPFVRYPSLEVAIGRRYCKMEKEEREKLFGKVIHNLTSSYNLLKVNVIIE